MEHRSIRLAGACVFLIAASTCLVATAAADLMCGSLSGGDGGIVICPAGDGDDLTDRGYPIVVDLDSGSLPSSATAEDLFLTGADSNPFNPNPLSGPITLCNTATTPYWRTSDADSYLSVYHNAPFSGTIRGGGSATWLSVWNHAIYNSIMACYTNPPIHGTAKVLLTVRSPDLNGDAVVDLIDFSMFGVDMNEDNLRSDFNFDGTVDLIDFAIFATHWQHACQ